jgi:hypothetical protein
LDLRKPQLIGDLTSKVSKLAALVDEAEAEDSITRLVGALLLEQR